MSKERSARAHAIFCRALRLDRAERPAMVAAECAGDTELQTKVNRLLEAADRSTGFLERPALAALNDPGPVPDAVGNYLVLADVLQELGDPRGEAIVRWHAGTRGERIAIEKLLGPTPPRHAQVDWFCGYVRHFRIFVDDEDPGFGDALRNCRHGHSLMLMVALELNLHARCALPVSLTVIGVTTLSP